MPRMPREPATERGWTVSEKSGQATLNRRHPLTIEGDELGNFDVVFACGGSADSYDVTYNEKRRSADARPVAEALKQVAISVGRRSVPLKIVTSEVRAKPVELASVARGAAPAALIESLARDGNRSLTVTTSTTNGVETVIRIGNIGVAQHLPRLAASCKQPSPPRADVQAELLPAKAADVGSVGRPK
jgi:hypothetical protein